MPIYQYQCAGCSVEFDIFQKMSSDPLTDCLHCKAPAMLHRVPTLPHTDLKEFHTPIEMHSIAMEDEQEIKDFIRKTGVEVSLDPNDPNYGVPIARCRSQKCKALDAAGFAERN